MWIDADPNDPAHTIPLSELTRPDPILFYAEVPLFEDELHDNGSSQLLVRIVRICSLDWYWRWFCLRARKARHAHLHLYPCGFTLRVDNVLFRIHDTRILHSFTSSPPIVVRQLSGWEAPYDRVKRVRRTNLLWICLTRDPAATA